MLAVDPLLNRTSVYFDLADAAGNRPDVWPVPLAETREMLRGLMVTLEELSRTLPAADRTIVALAGIWIFSAVGALVDVTMQLEACDAQNVAFVSRNPLISWLKDGNGSPGQSNLRVGAAAESGLVSHTMLRRLARVVLSNPPRALARALMKPRHVAITHNALLNDVARQIDVGVGYQHAGAILHDARQFRSGEAARSRLLADAVTHALLQGVTANEARLQRLYAVSHQIALEHLMRAETDLAGLAAIPKLPNSVWLATGGNYPARAVALEVRRRGGETTVFDHGGCTGMFKWTEALRFVDLRPATRFVTMSHGTAALLRDNALVAALPANWRPEIVGHSGDRAFEEMTALPPVAQRERPRVLYTIGAYSGFRQYFPPILHDAVYHHVMLEIAEALRMLPIDFVCKPRPAAGSSHPVQKIAPADFRPFETVVHEADVVVFDDVHSTTFWKTLCTDRKVVVLNFGFNEFSPTVEGYVRKRCRVIDVAYDNRNIPRIDIEALSAAVLRPNASGADGGFARQLLAKNNIGSAAVERLG